MKKYIYIEADTNDGDYVSRKREVTDEQIEKIKPMIEAINLNPSAYNYLKGEIVGPEEENAEKYYIQKAGISQHVFNLFDSFVPRGQYGVHTIESVKILHIAKEEILI